MKKSLILIFTILTLGVFAFSEVKVGVINAQEIMQKTKRGQQVQKKLEGMQKERQQKIISMQDGLKKLEKELSSPALNADTRSKKTREAQDKKLQLQRFLEDAQKEMQMATQKEIMKLQKEIMPIIQEIGKQKGFTLIFDVTSSGITYFDKAIDFTAEVIKAVDAKLPGK
jgi:outer membrane protein